MRSITTTPAPSSAFFEYQQFPSSSSFRIPHSFEAEFQLLQIPNGMCFLTGSLVEYSHTHCTKQLININGAEAFFIFLLAGFP